MRTATVENNPRPTGTTVLQRPSVDEWIVDLLRTDGPQTMDQLANAVPGINWAQFFLAVDRLSRSGRVSVWPPQNGDYLLSLKP
jgi:hypothetical protein